MFVWRPRKSSWPIGIYHDFEPYLSFLVFSPLVKIYMLHRYGLYKLRGEFSFGNDFAKIASASTLASLVLVLIAFIFRQGFSYRDGHWISLDFSYSRLVFVYDWLIAIAAFWSARAIVRVIQIIYRSAERNLIPTVVVGCGEVAQVCVSEISEKPRLGYRLVGAVRARVNEDSTSLADYGVRMLGGFDDLPDLVKRYDVEEVLITDTRINPRKMFEVLMECGRDHHIKYRVIPNLFDCLPGNDRLAADHQALRRAAAWISTSGQARDGHACLDRTSFDHVAVLAGARDYDQDGIARPGISRARASRNGRQCVFDDQVSLDDGRSR